MSNQRLAALGWVQAIAGPST